MTLVGLAARKLAQKQRTAKLAAAFPNGIRCQKCLNMGHWSYECKEKRKYVHRSSRTKQLSKHLAEKCANAAESTPGNEARSSDARGEMRLGGEKRAKRKKKRANSSSSSSSSESSSKSSSDSSNSDSSSSSSSSDSDSSSSDDDDDSSTDADSGSSSDSESDGSSSNSKSSNSADERENSSPKKKKRRDSSPDSSDSGPHDA